MYNFKENKLGINFCNEDVIEIKKLIANSVSFSIVSMPGLGVSMFLRFLATQNIGTMIHLDINELTTLSKESLFNLLAKELGGEPKSVLVNLVKKEKRIVIIFNRFERLKKEFSHEFFANLRSLRDIDKEKIVMIFTGDKPLTEIAQQSISGGNLNMFSKTYFLKPFSNQNLDLLVKLNSPTIIKFPEYEKLLKLSGGHYQLLQLLTKSDEKAVDLQLKQLYEFLNYSQRKLLQRLSLNKSVKSFDEGLINYGYVEKGRIFTPLLLDYIKKNTYLRLPALESKLFKLLKQKEGHLVNKDEIFNVLWPEEEGSDWALNALIYRLRKNPTFSTSGYVIESQKKLGYFLVKN
jgi:hypothetical protein